MAKEKNKFGVCHVCGVELSKYHLSKKGIRLCTFKCADIYQEDHGEGDNLEQTEEDSKKPFMMQASQTPKIKVTDKDRRHNPENIAEKESKK